jgi:hypothetical protein
MLPRYHIAPSENAATPSVPSTAFASSPCGPVPARHLPALTSSLKAGSASSRRFTTKFALRSHHPLLSGYRVETTMSRGLFYSYHLACWALAALAFCFTFRVAGDAFTPKPLSTRQNVANSSVLEVFQVNPPVLTPAGATCEQTLMVHSFGNSYGQPYVGK